MPGRLAQGSTYRSIFEWLPVPALLIDGHLRIVLANRAARDLLKLTSQCGTSVASVLGDKAATQMARDNEDTGTTIVEIRTEFSSSSSTVLKVTSTRLWGDKSSRPTTCRVVDPKAHEFRVLVLEDMTESAMVEERLVQAEKLAGMGQLAAGVAHEMANPLTAIVCNLTYIRDNVRGPNRDAILEALDATAERMTDMYQLLSNLSGFVRQHQPRYERTDLHDLIRRVAVFIGREAENRRIQLSVDVAPANLACDLDARLIRHVLLNLLKNSMEAMPNGGRLQIRSVVSATELPEAQNAIVEISDSGVGIPEDDLRRVFRPLFTTKSEGAGLGLSFCRMAVEEHGGQIHLTSQLGAGTTVTITLPVSQSILCA